jgi:hypothetical protein
MKEAIILKAAHLLFLPVLRTLNFLTFFIHTAADMYGEIDTEI